MHTALQFAALVFSLGLDTLCIAIALGLSRTNNHLLTGLTFTSFAVMVPLIGLLLGQSLEAHLGAWVRLTGAILLIGVGLYMVFRRHRDRDVFEKPLTGWVLVTAAATSTLDQMVVGFAMALVHVPMAPTIALIASVALVLSFIGLRYSVQLQPLFGAWADTAGGVGLALLGMWLVVVLL